MSIRKLTTSEGMMLTNGLAYGKEIYLGVNDDPENWYEITEEAYEEILKQQESEMATEEDYKNALRDMGVSV